MSRVIHPESAAQLRMEVELQALGLGMEKVPEPVNLIVETCEELEHQGMEPGAYTVTMEQYLEVANDLILSIMHQI